MAASNGLYKQRLKRFSVSAYLLLTFTLNPVKRRESYHLSKRLNHYLKIGRA